MDAILTEVVRALLAHSECIALFILLVLQQYAMHTINIRKLNTLHQQLRSVSKQPATEEDTDATH